MLFFRTLLFSGVLVFTFTFLSFLMKCARWLHNFVQMTVEGGKTAAAVDAYNLAIIGLFL
jgi:hypothetical protein